MVTTSALITTLEQLFNNLESREKQGVFCSSQTPTVGNTYYHLQPLLSLSYA
ncbi:hypothetical protein TPB0596_32050 [Tsukamurella pulmonis]|nr:hypothetical protein TPB0596_32050 [Tsukamurella pulmonis]